MPTRIKICGITRTDDAVGAAAAGADAIGLMFYPGSPRVLGLDAASSIRKALPPFMSAVAVFMDPERQDVHRVVDSVHPDLLQFHGNEPESFCTAFGLPYIKTIPMSTANPLEYAIAYPWAAGFLLDSHAAGTQGGSGKKFDWKRVPEKMPSPVILAGGLNPDNVAEAVTQVRPYAVDVSSGVESAPGIKDPTLMTAFVQGVHRGEV